MGGGRPYDMRADGMSRQSRHTRFVEAAWPIQRNSKSERHTSRYASGRIRWRVSEPTLDVVEVQVASYFVIACLRQMKNGVWLL